MNCVCLQYGSLLIYVLFFERPCINIKIPSIQRLEGQYAAYILLIRDNNPYKIITPRNNAIVWVWTTSGNIIAVMCNLIIDLMGSRHLVYSFIIVNWLIILAEWAHHR